MSENKELFLNHLDFKITRKYKTSKMFTGVAFALLAVHATVKQLTSSQEKRRAFQAQL